MRLATDTGGTFTDLVVEDDDGAITLHKASTVPSDPVVGVLDALRVAATTRGLSLAELLGRCDSFIHGTTHAINATAGSRINVTRSARRLRPSRITSQEVAPSRSSRSIGVMRDTRTTTAWLFIRGKAVPDKAPELLSIITDVLTTARLDNRERIKQMLLEEVRRQGKPYGLIIGDIIGGCPTPFPSVRPTTPPHAAPAGRATGRPACCIPVPVRFAAITTVRSRPSGIERSTH